MWLLRYLLRWQPREHWLLRKPYPTNGCPGRVARLTDALHEERSLIGQADRRARAHLPESLSEHFGGEVVASPYLPPIV